MRVSIAENGCDDKVCHQIDLGMLLRGVRRFFAWQRRDKPALPVSTRCPGLTLAKLACHASAMPCPRLYAKRRRSPTVKRHVYNLCGKLGMQSSTQAIARARALNLL